MRSVVLYDSKIEVELLKSVTLTKCNVCTLHTIMIYNMNNTRTR